MRSILYSLIVLAIMLYSCDGMHDSQDKYSGEIVYPAQFDTIIGKIGFERVEIDLLKVGRIPSSQIKLGKAKKTVIEYDDQEKIIDELVSWVNITDLTQSKLYRFKISTMDEYGNKSVPQEIALIPYTSSDLATLVIASPRVMTSPTAAVIDWPNGLSSVLLNYYGLTYAYTDKDGAKRTGERKEDSRFFVGNLETGQSVAIDIKYRVVPKVNNISIIDTLTVSQPLTVNMPTGSTPFPPAERSVLETNGITEFTADGVASFNKIVYPIHANSLQDLFYFPNLKEIDLTGGTLFSLPTLLYDRNNIQSTVGGGEWIPFMRKAGNITGGAQTLKDLLESGILEKVRYVPNSMGLDEVLEPYVASGVVELVNLPDEVLIPHKFWINGVVQSADFKVDVTHPATDAPAGSGIENAYKLILRGKSSSFVFALPKEYQFNITEYKYLKFKVYAPAKSSFNGDNASFQILWPRFMNYMWAFTGNSTFGQESWDAGKVNYKIADADLQTWKDFTIDLSSAVNKHNRVIIMNIGGEPGKVPTGDIIYYFANFRFTK